MFRPRNAWYLLSCYSVACGKGVAIASVLYEPVNYSHVGTLCCPAYCRLPWVLWLIAVPGDTNGLPVEPSVLGAR
uniref:Putative secreted protein n=1 Tax=Anopheles darlingi TaxID=43151 RepID=A0A2M4DQ85_ANODA